jgi:ornithine cyclodeaminase
MSQLPFLDAATLRKTVAIADLLDAVEAAYRDVAHGRDRSPLRSRVPLPAGGDLLLMPGVRDGGAGASVKIVTVVPDNPARGLPTIHALVLWLDALTGEPRALLDGETLTAMRTGAASGVATRLLAREESRVLALFGAGGQAEWQLRCVAAARPIEEVRVVTRSAEARDAFAARMAGEMGLAVHAMADPRQALTGADVVCCATTSTEPVFEADWVAAGTHVNGIGAFRRGMLEMPPPLFARASLVAVDSRAAAAEEAGDLIAAIEAGMISDDAPIEIGTIERDWAQRRPAEAITVFKSVGLAIQDVAATELAAASWGRRGA